MRDAAVSGAAAAASQAFFDLVDPHNARRDGFSHFGGAPHILLGLTDESSEDLAQVELEQRHFPFGGDGLGGETLAAAGDSNQQQTLWIWEAELARGFRERPAAGPQPAFQFFESSNRAETLGSRIVLQHSRLADDLLFFREQQFHVFLVDARACNDHFCQGVLGFRPRQAVQCFNDLFAGVAGQVDFDLRVILHLLDGSSKAAASSASSGMARSSTVTSFSSSGGIFNTEERITTVLRLALNGLTRSRN